MEKQSHPTPTPPSETPSELEWSKDKEVNDRQWEQLRQLYREGCLMPKEGSEVDLSRFLNPPKDDPPKK